MNRKVLILVLSGVVVLGLLAWGRGSLTLATTRSAANEPSSQSTRMQQWEYCAITSIDHISDEGLNWRYRVRIAYSRDYGTNHEEVFESKFNPLFTALDRLGRDGWELVGPQDNTGFSGYSPTGIFFKRPKP
jgi:hypothetical protein